jgi:hypothetical protein
MAIRASQDTFVQFCLCPFPIHEAQLVPGIILIAGVVKLHGSIVMIVAAMRALTAKILNRLLLSCYPSPLAIVIETGFAD